MNYSNFSDVILRNSENIGRRPTEVMLELTRRCTIRCTHCYIGDARFQKDPDELSTGEVIQLLDCLKESGTLWLCFTGGEPMLRHDFKELWVAAKERGFLLTLFTNGTLITESMARFFLKYPPFNIEISIYGSNKIVYEKISLVPGSYERAMRGIHALKSMNIPFKLKTTVISDNIQDLTAMKEVAKNLNTSFRFDTNINPSIGYGKTAGMAPCATRGETEEVTSLEVDAIDPKQLAESLELENRTGRGDRLFSCGAGLTSVYITSQGQIQPCILTPHRAESVRSESDNFSERFSKIWNEFGELQNIKRDPTSPCLSCDISSICESCAGFAHLETGNEHSAVAWLCKNTHLKAYKLGMNHKCDESHYVYETRRKKEKNIPETGNHQDQTRC